MQRAYPSGGRIGGRSDLPLIIFGVLAAYFAPTWLWGILAITAASALWFGPRTYRFALPVMAVLALIIYMAAAHRA